MFNKIEIEFLRIANFELMVLFQKLDLFCLSPKSTKFKVSKTFLRISKLKCF